MTDKQSIDIIDVLIVLAKRKRFIVLTTFYVTLAVIVYSLLAPKYWQSQVSFLSINQDKSPLLGAQALLAGIGTTIPTTDRNHVNVLRSRAFSELIVRKFDLIEYFKIKDADSLAVMQRAIEQLHDEVMNIIIDDETGMISIAIETKERFLSPQIANAYFDLLEQYSIDSKMSKGRERRIFLEGRIRTIENDFKQYSALLEDFQTETRLIDMQSQTEAIIGIYADVAAKKIEAEIELEYARKVMRGDHHLINSIEEKILVLNNQLSQLESTDSSVIINYFINLDDIPSLANRLVQLTLNIEIQKKVIEFLYPQLEQAKLDELSDISSFELIDRAVPAGLRSRPKRAKMVIIGFVISFLLSSIIAYSSEALLNSTRKDKFEELIRTIFSKN